MKNPLMKRIPRELREDLAKYLVIFAFMVMLIALVSGFLVTDGSFEYLYNRGFTEQRVEDGHISFKKELPKEVFDAIEEKGDVSLHNLFYFEETLKDTEKTVRVYSMARDVNLPSLLRGEFPEAADEIALDRMFADNNGIDVGDTVTLKDRELRVSGLIASPDYSCLFEKNTDMMFDSINFAIAAMTEDGFNEFGSHHITYNYAWLYPEFVRRTDKETAKQKSDALIDVLEEVITRYDTELMGRQVEQTLNRVKVEGLAAVLQSAVSSQQTNMEADVKAAQQQAVGTEENSADGQRENTDHETFVEVQSYLPRYLNQAINFTGDDMGSDRAMFLLFDYLITMVIAFVFAVTTENTIAKEAGVIGTLRASGYTKRELLGHYMVLPVCVSFLAAVVGNILGYTVLVDFFKKIYYGSYSFPRYEQRWSADAFWMTTVIPLILMTAINLLTILRVLKFSPLRFLRHDLSRRGRKKAFRLSRRLPFLYRFRLRILFQNVPNYLTLFCGIFLGGMLMVFGTMFKPMLADYKELIVSDRICDYQYVLMDERETSDAQAEKYSLTSLATLKEGYVEDEVSVFGIVKDSRYVKAELADGTIAVSSAFADKYGYQKGDTFELKDPYNSKKRYEFTVGSVYDYISGMAVFMTRADYAEKFGEDEASFTGYFSNEELADLPEQDVAMVITTSDLTKVSDQLTVSMGEMMSLFCVFGVIVFVLLMFLLGRQIIEKNAGAISMTKILGFSDREIGRLYIVATSVIVVLSLLVTVPLVDTALRFAFSSYIYTMMAGYIPYIVSGSCYVKMVAAGIVCYVLISVVLMRKIGMIPKSDALKNNME